MPKFERHTDWLNKYYKNYNIDGILPLKSGEIADICNSELDTKASTKGPSPKNRRIMTNGVDAQIVGRHMQELRKKAAGQPRSTRRIQTAKNRIDRVLAKRGGRLWTGDRMLLAMLNKTSPANIKNYVEEKNRQKRRRARKAGGQVFQDWEAWKSSIPSSNKYANKMWAAYNETGEKDKYLQKLASGLISLETGETIEGNSIEHPGSSLNPANGYTESTGDGDGNDEAVDADANKAIVDDGDYPVGNDIENYFEFQTKCDLMVDSFEYPDHIMDLPQPQMQVENGVNPKKLNLADGNFENAGSQMGFQQNHDNTDRNFGERPLSYNTQIGGPNSRTNLSEYEASDTRPMTQDNGPMLASMQTYSNNAHSRNMHMGFEPNPQVQSSKYTGEPVRQRRYERSDVGSRKEQDMRASHFDYQVHEDQSRYPNASQMLPTSLPKKRKEPLLEEGVLDIKPSKRQYRPGECLESERRLEFAQHSQHGKRENGLNVDVSGVGESLEPNLNFGTDFNKIADSMIVEKTKTLQERDVHVLATSTVQSHKHKNAVQRRQSVFWSIVAHPQGGLRTEQVSSRENRESGRLGRRSGDKPDNAIVIPEDCGEVGTVESSHGTVNRITVDERQSAKNEEQSSHLWSLSSPKGYANTWYSQGRIRTSEEPSESPWQASHHFDGIPPSISVQPRRR
ncbi:hypothetical protein BOTCAL_0105g00080 [Botryotinia calthae]|uniref:Uncharacterized protein n=1 Tax=Botryotinia calthae TaxID=38488 RepID=A0A4Y8D692_9HELO|nr:hypothetical protein BOTCAL_0105g00080 [Botryotinia calthae]